MRVYRRYWKTHPVGMALMIALRVGIGILLNQSVVVRVQRDESTPLAGFSDKAS